MNEFKRENEIEHRGSFYSVQPERDREHASTFFSCWFHGMFYGCCSLALGLAEAQLPDHQSEYAKDPAEGRPAEPKPDAE
jgi:hypothetical protein